MDSLACCLLAVSRGGRVRALGLWRPEQLSDVAAVTDRRLREEGGGRGVGSAAPESVEETC